MVLIHTAMLLFSESNNALPEKLIHSREVVLVLGKRLPRWPNIKPTVDQLRLFTGQTIPIGSKPGTSGAYPAAVAIW